jgi:hypothetical protein
MVVLAVAAPPISGMSHGTRAWFQAGEAGQMFQGLAPASLNYSGTVVVPGNAGVSSESGKDLEFAIPYIRPGSASTPQGFKGYGRLIRFKGSNRASGSRLSTGVSTYDRLVIGDFTMPWNASLVTP